ncbi:Zn-dependent hydrolase [Rubrobacter xylanophilus]|uniref:Zn-dependent hydrolase n=1 Tax=Rubrobacter xylanophilus TaxID=49319 RepID=UPI0012EA09BE
MNGERLWSRLAELSTIGMLEGGGVTRLSFTKEERAAKNLVTSYMEEAGLHVYEDAIGNLFGRLEGSDPEAPAVLVGSHLDSVINGGNFDGPLGVLAGIEVLQAMKEQKCVVHHPVEVVAFTDEEGARFGFGMIGSRALAGTLTTEDLQRTDENGVSIAEAMRACGLDPARIHEAIRPSGSVKAYVEVHIEQGSVLENKGLPVGIASGLTGSVRLQFTLKGEARHAGTTPMNLRRDALAAAAEAISLIESSAAATGTTVGTVGHLKLKPGSINVIPGWVTFTLDLRDIDERRRDIVEKRIVRGVEKICEKRKIELKIMTLQRNNPVRCSKLVRDAATLACKRLGIAPFELPSGAGHDGMQLTGLCPMGMILVRSKDGISHSPNEYSSKEDCSVAAEVLYHAVLSLAGGD